MQLVSHKFSQSRISLFISKLSLLPLSLWWQLSSSRLSMRQVLGKELQQKGQCEVAPACPCTSLALVLTGTCPDISIWSLINSLSITCSYLNSEYSSPTIVLSASPMFAKTQDGSLWPAGLHVGFTCLPQVLLTGYPQYLRATVTPLLSLHRGENEESACSSFLQLKREHRLPYISPTSYKSPSPDLSLFAFPNPGHCDFLPRPILHSTPFVQHRLCAPSLLGF